MNRTTLLNAVEKTKPAMTGTALTEQDNLIMFDGREIISFNDEILIIAPIRTKIKGAVPAKELLDLLQKMKDDTIQIEQKGDVVSVTGKTTKAKLKVSQGVDIPDVALPDKWKTIPQDFLDGIKLCRCNVAETGNALHNILIEGDKVISSDNYRVTEYTMKTNAFKRKCLVPASISHTLISFVPISYASNKSWSMFKNDDGAVLCIRKVDVKYPDVQAFLSKKIKGTKVALPEELKESLERTRILSDEDIVTGNRMVKVTIKKDTMLCHGECALGQIDEHVKIDYSGKEISFHIVPDFLYEILGKTQSMTVGEETLKFKTKTFQHTIQLIT